ncbi:C3 family ADP-ribosyltransferase [Streptococcus pyogenes]|nr:C3 family ADP-ribosyltransferase [Streptococcus pyogenes]VHF91907.1 C3 family ADP-ribosyltransferase [Streptococcus pyogenes]VHI79564.1 ADP-ribosyltransferase [Streptococcus pyogenes]
MLKKRYQLAMILLLSCFSLVWQTEGLIELFVCEHYERAVCEGTPAYFTFSDQKGAETLIKKRWGKGLVYPRAEQEAMAAYTCQQAGPINTSLDKAKGKLSQLTPELRDQVAQLDAATHRLVIPWNIVVYRYVYETFLRDIGVSHADLTSYYRNHQFDPHILCKIKLGTRYTKHSFMSTTALKNGAMTHRDRWRCASVSKKGPRQPLSSLIRLCLQRLSSCFQEAVSWRSLELTCHRTTKSST